MFYQYPPIGDEHVFEEFCKDLFNTIYNTTHFQTYKTKGAKQHGIDIYSLPDRIVIQSKKKKLLRSDYEIQKELATELEESINLASGLPFTFKKFILATTSKKYGVVENLAIELTRKTGFDISFLSWEDIDPLITQYPNIRKKYFSSLFQETDEYPKIITYIPTVDSQTIIGREDDYFNLSTSLAETSKILLLNGMGGVGKSTLAKLFVTKTIDTYTHILWVDYVDIAPDAHDDEMLYRPFTSNVNVFRNLKIGEITDFNEKERFHLITNKLSNLPGHNLLIIDNVPKSFASIEGFLPGSPNWRVIVTSRHRIGDLPTIELTVLNIDDAITLFYQYYRIERNDQLIRDILSLIGNHTLTIELLSKTANKRRFGLMKLRDDLNIYGLNIPNYAKVTSDHDQARLPVNHFEYLLKIFSLAELDHNEKEILSCLSVLPSESIGYSNLKLLFGIQQDDNAFFESITSLAESGWLKQVDDLYQMHQVIQDVVRTKLRPSLKSSRIVFEQLHQILSIEFHENHVKIKAFLNYAESYLSFIVEDSFQFGLFFNIVGLRHEDFNHFERAIYYYHKAEAIFEKHGAAALLDLSFCYNNLQSVLKTIGKIDEAFQYQFKAIGIQEKIYPFFHPDLASSYNNLALLYDISDDYANAIEYMKRSLEICEATLPDDHPHLASTYGNLSLALHRIGDHRSALAYQEKSFAIRLKTLESNHPELAESYNNLSVMYQENGQLSRAEELLLKSIEIKELIHGPEAYQLGTAYSNLGALYIKKGDYTQAEKFQLKAIEIETKALGQDHHEVATSYGSLAVIKCNQGHYQEAIQCCRTAYSITAKSFPQGHPSLAMYVEFEKVIRGKMPYVVNKPGRNSLCSCGSNKKFKYCCGKE
ncbi:tetratricopeptide repeat protein [Mucilaginibacter gossypii]|uniref:tetratricopeptide repeat protein n=1 Tax=Mucilaginibacter gossypii TaxID=551996 RepID=UPI000DCE7E28|nr:tetratricopeptide repeat protein [Mucilaginibacter gossypii]QTE36376.1 tetratricopeptide repeat protein [Mucilaginibacter gossypii]RAV55872.1 hypothetical protein DIU36_16270 [Mucilaginibacter rubeus]